MGGDLKKIQVGLAPPQLPRPRQNHGTCGAQRTAAACWQPVGSAGQGCPALGSLAWTGSYFPHCPPPGAAAQVVGRYLVEIWKAVGMNMDRVEFLSASGEACRRRRLLLSHPCRWPLTWGVSAARPRCLASQLRARRTRRWTCAGPCSGGCSRLAVRFSAPNGSQAGVPCWAGAHTWDVDLGLLPRPRM